MWTTQVAFEGIVTSPHAQPEVRSPEPEVVNRKFKFPAKIQIKKNFIETIQIDQWERFPPKKNLSIKNQSEAASFCLSD